MSEPNQLLEIERLKTENANLRAQLDQTIEELRFYFKRCQDLAPAEKADTRPDAPAARSTANTQENSESIAAIINLRHLIDGDNWYNPEEDGRWAGPNLTSKIRIPVVPPGSYNLEIVVAAAMAPDIVNQLKVFLDQREIELKKIYYPHKTGIFMPLMRWKARLLNSETAFPVALCGRVLIEKSSKDQQLHLELKFPRTVSPGASGGTDDRHLALRVSDIILRR